MCMLTAPIIKHTAFAVVAFIAPEATEVHLKTLVICLCLLLKVNDSTAALNKNQHFCLLPPFHCQHRCLGRLLCQPRQYQNQIKKYKLCPNVFNISVPFLTLKPISPIQHWASVWTPMTVTFYPSLLPQWLYLILY